MLTTTELEACSECGHGNDGEAVCCAVCGTLLETAPPEAAPEQAFRAPKLAISWSWDSPFVYLLVGAALAPVFTFTPILKFMGWFLGALCHETGHCVVAWLAGCPAYPAISLAGHAMARHGAQSMFLCFMIWTAIAYITWTVRRNTHALVGMGAAVLLYPLFAFTGVREGLFLLGGHVAELSFAGIFFWRTLVGGFTDSRAERVAYATVAWFLVGRNVWLAGGLMWSDEVIAWYQRATSFGIPNDYIRLSRDVLGVGLGTVAFFMLLAALAVLPAAWYVSRLRRYA